MRTKQASRAARIVQQAIDDTRREDFTAGYTAAIRELQSAAGESEDIALALLAERDRDPRFFAAKAWESWA